MIQTLLFSNRLDRRVFGFAPVFFLATAAFAQSPAGVPNFHAVNDRIYRGAQPTGEGVQNLAKMGVKTVINLRSDNTTTEEKSQVEAAGMRFVNIPMHGMETPSDEAVQKVLALFENGEAGPVFVHCRRGADRTGAVVACYRVAHDRWENRKALDEAKSLGMSWMQRAIQRYVLNYKGPAENAAAPTPVPAVPESSVQPGGGGLFN